jgi:hypothetical protein
MKIPLGIAATDLDSGEGILFRRGDTGTAVRASSAVPAVFQPVRIGQREYVDGGLSAPIPVHHARQMGAEFVIAVDISAVPEGNATGDAARMLLQTFAIMGKSLKAYELRDADLVLQPQLSGVSGADFTTRRQSIKAGATSRSRTSPSCASGSRRRAGSDARAPELRRRGTVFGEPPSIASIRKWVTPCATSDSASPRGRPSGTTGMNADLKRNKATAAADADERGRHSKRPPAPAARARGREETASSAITPTTAAVFGERAVNPRSPCVDSIRGPPRRTKQNDGRKVK